MKRPRTGDRASGTGLLSSETGSLRQAPESASAAPGARTPNPVSIVGVKFLNARPLTAGLEAGIPAPFPYLFQGAEPSVCADRLAAREASVGLIPVAALPVIPKVRAVPSLGVAAHREVRSVLLISRVPPERVRILAIDAASRTSVVLARLLLTERWGARPRLVSRRPPLEQMLVDVDAAVIIGDPAFAVHGRTGFLEVDLALAWLEWSGLPFVFAIWGVGPGSPMGIESLLERSLGYAEENWEELLLLWAHAHRVGLADAREYLGETLTFRLGDAEQAGMQEFLRRAAGAGMLPRREEVWAAC